LSAAQHRHSADRLKRPLMPGVEAVEKVIFREFAIDKIK